MLRMDQATVVASGVPRHALPLGFEIISSGRRIPGRAITLERLQAARPFGSPAGHDRQNPADDKSALHTTQLRPRTMERARALRLMIDSGLGPESALVMTGAERHPVAKTSRRYHPGTRRPGRTTGTLRKKQKSRSSAVVAKPATGSTPTLPAAATTSSPTSTSGAALKPSRKWVRTLGRTGISRTSHRNSQ